MDIVEHRIVLVGTGTEVGKTHVGEVLARRLVAMGEQVAALKPVETGVEPSSEGGSSDAQRLAAAAKFHVKQSRYQFAPPISPHLAARLEGVSIDLDSIASWVDGYDASWQLVETAGGLLSPLNRKQTNLDLAVRLEPTAVVLVGLDRLGVLHDITACLSAIDVMAVHLRPRVHVVLSSPEEPDRSTGTNTAELRELAIAERAWALPRCVATDPAALAAVEELVAELSSGG